MFLPKINQILKFKTLNRYQARALQGWIDQYNDVIKNLPITLIQEDSQIVKNELPHPQALINFLTIISRSYRTSGGDASKFKATLYSMQEKLPPNHPQSLLINRQPCKMYRLFNILSSPHPNIPKLVTFSQWDKLMGQIIFTWCSYHNQRIDLKTIFQIIDRVNGDHVNP